MDQLNGLAIIIADRDAISLDWSRVRTDLQQFQETCQNKAADFDSVERAVLTARSELLEAYQEDWVRDVRKQVLAHRSELLVRYAQLLLERQDPRAASEFEACLETDPTSQAILKGWCAAQREIARLADGDMVELARKSLPPASAAVVQELLANSTPREQLSAESDESFVGRRSEQTLIQQLLSESRLVTIVGVGGVGKTRLARQVGRSFEGGFIEVDLTDADSAGEALTIFAHSLDVSDDGSRALVEEVAAALVRSKKLIIVDNCEHIVDETAELLRSILQTTSAVRFLATSRVALGLAQERVVSVKGLDYSEQGDDSDAMQMFFRCAARSGTKVDRQWHDLALELIEQVDGLPLGIELATAQLRKMDLATLVRQLRVLPNLLSSRSAPARHRSLEEVLTWSISQLGPDARRLLHACSVFGGGFTRAALSFVADMPDELLDEAFVELLEFSLIHELSTTMDRRYKLLETVRVTTLATFEDDLELRRRHAEFYARRIERLDVEYMQMNRPRAFYEIEAEFANVLAVFHAAKRYPECARFGLELCISMWTYWDHTMRFVEAAHHYAEVLPPAVSAGHRPGRIGKGYLILGRMLSTMSRHEEAQVALKQGFDYVVEAENDGLIQLAHMSIGRDAVLRGDFDEALENLQKACETAEKAGDKMGAAWAAAALGEFYSEFGWHADSILWNRRACDIFFEIKLDTFTDDLLTIVANSERNLGRLASARAQLEKLLQSAHVQTDMHALYNVKQNLAEVHMDAGDVEAAEALFVEVTRLRKESDLPRLYALSLRHRSALYCVLGRLDEAEPAIQEAYAIQQQYRAIQRQAVCEQWLARIALERGDRATAQAMIQQSLEKMGRGRNRSQIAKTVIMSAWWALEVGLFEHAIRWLVIADRQERRLGHAVPWYDRTLRSKLAMRIANSGITAKVEPNIDVLDIVPEVLSVISCSCQSH